MKTFPVLLADMFGLLLMMYSCALHLREYPEKALYWGIIGTGILVTALIIGNLIDQIG